MGTLWQDIVFGYRVLLKRPAFTLVASLSLALGIGANTTIFSLINATLLGSFSYPSPDRLVMIWNVPVERRDQRSSVTASSFAAWKAQSHSFESMGAMYGFARNLGAGDDGSPAERVEGQRVTPGLFQVLGVRPQLGRIFSE